MEKPDADLIDGITPAIAIQQRAVTKNPRSTVATVTEIYDFLRVLFARIGTIHCLNCGKPVRRDTVDSIVEALYKLSPQTKIQISFSWPLEKGLGPLRKGGFFRVIQQNKIVNIEEAKLGQEGKIDVLVDRMALDRSERERLVDSLEIGLREGNGKIKVRADTNQEFIFSDRLECKTCEIMYEEPFPNLFSFNSPQGACPACHGFGDLAILDEDKIIPDKNKTLEEGAVEPWTKPVSRRLMRKLVLEAESRGIPTDVPFKDLKDEWKKFVFEGEGRFKGVKEFFKRLQRKKYKVQVRVFLSRYRKYIPCPDCQQRRLNPQVPE